MVEKATRLEAGPCRRDSSLLLSTTSGECGPGYRVTVPLWLGVRPSLSKSLRDHKYLDLPRKYAEYLRGGVLKAPPRFFAPHRIIPTLLAEAIYSAHGEPRVYPEMGRREPSFDKRTISGTLLNMPFHLWPIQRQLVLAAPRLSGTCSIPLQPRRLSLPQPRMRYNLALA